jgi:rhombotail lipoprotein
MKSATRLILVALLAGVTAGCSWWFTETDSRSGVSSSLVDYLYPRGEVPPPPDDTTPQLELPIRVGLAFVPGSGDQALTEAQRHVLLDRVKAAFVDRDFIETIEIIPETYLRQGSGFETLEGVARLYRVQAMALVSYDQVAFVGDAGSSFWYWTIVGAYVVKGSEHEVQTFVDTAVFDMGTRSLLFRAPGADRMESKSTLVDAAEVRRDTMGSSFERAMADMTVNLDAELDRFRARVKEDQVAVVTYKPGHEQKGGGASGYFLLLVAGLAVAARKRLRRT